MDPFLFLILLSIIILSTLNLIKLIDVQNKLKELQRSKDDTINKLYYLQESGLFDDKDISGKIKKYKSEIKTRYVHDYLDDLFKQGLLTKEELDEKLNEFKKRQKQWNDVMELRKQTKEDDIVNFAEKHEDSWLCVCGTENELALNNCSNCKRNQQFVLSEYSR